jgi:hypothetical protein
MSNFPEVILLGCKFGVLVFLLFKNTLVIGGEGLNTDTHHELRSTPPLLL